MGFFQEKIYIERPETTTFAGGGHGKTYVEIATLKGDVQPVSSAENVRAGRKSSDETLKIYVDPEVDVEMTDKIIFAGDMYKVVEKVKFINAYTKLIIEKII